MRFEVRRNELQRKYASERRAVVWSVWDNDKHGWASHHVTREDARRGKQFAEINAWAKERIDVV